jgi:hypothetical protein
MQLSTAVYLDGLSWLKYFSIKVRIYWSYKYKIIKTTLIVALLHCNELSN